MEFPEKFNKFYWWIILIIISTMFLFIRKNSIINGIATPMDIVIFLIWIALLLVPIFEEIDLFGIKLKSEIQDLKTDLTSQILSLRTEVHSSIDLKTEIKPNFYLNPPTDEQLTKKEGHNKKILDKALKNKGIDEIKEYHDLNISDEVKFLFSVRYQIEKEIKRIWTEIYFGNNKRRFSVVSMARELAEAGIIDRDYLVIIIEIIRICNPAIHVEDFSKKQVEFVKKTAPELIALLKSIK